MADQDALARLIDRGIAEGLDDAELRLLVQEFTTPPASATAGMPEPSRPTDRGRPEAPADFVVRMVGNIPESAGNLVSGTLQGVASLGKGLATHPIDTLSAIGPGIVEHYSSRYGSPDARRRTVGEDPVGMVADLLPLSALRQLPQAARMVGRGARNAAAKTAELISEHPRAVSATVGAVSGGAVGGIGGAIGGGVGGAEAGPTVGRAAQSWANWLRGARPSAEASVVPPAVARGKQLEALLRGDSFDDLASFLGPAAQPKAGAVATGPSVPSEALARELLAREIDWRTVDAVPIDAIRRDVSRPGGAILEAGESRVGLAERMANALKGGQSQEAERLARALRQRMHITEKQTGARR